MGDESEWARGLDGEQIRILALVVAGLTDEAAAHRLGVSKRTVQRRVRDLMDMSGARNRMELGHRAALAGLPYRPGAEPGRPAGPAPRRFHRGPRTVRREEDRAKPDELDLVLLRELLVDGTPEAALGVSSRSVERRVHALMARAGAASRAQLGWRATCEGWI